MEIDGERLKDEVGAAQSLALAAEGGGKAVLSEVLGDALLKATASVEKLTAERDKAQADLATATAERDAVKPPAAADIATAPAAS